MAMLVITRGYTFFHHCSYTCSSHVTDIGSSSSVKMRSTFTALGAQRANSIEAESWWEWESYDGFSGRTAESILSTGCLINDTLQKNT